MSDNANGQPAAITSEQVAHIAQLAKIDLTPQELETFTHDLELIVRSVAKVQEVAGDDVPATSHPLPLQNVFRKDEVRASLSVEQALSSAPEREGDRFKVATILGEE